MKTIKVTEPDFDTATALAVEQARPAGQEGSLVGLVRVRTRRTRTFAMPERLTAKNGNRLFGAERKHPVVSGHRVVREFVFDA